MDDKFYYFLLPLGWSGDYLSIQHTLIGYEKIYAFTTAEKAMKFMWGTYLYATTAIVNLNPSFHGFEVEIDLPPVNHGGDFMGHQLDFRITNTGDIFVKGVELNLIGSEKSNIFKRVFDVNKLSVKHPFGDGIVVGLKDSKEKRMAQEFKKKFLSFSGEWFSVLEGKLKKTNNRRIVFGFGHELATYRIHTIR